MKWHYVSDEQPKEAGIYWTTLIYPEYIDGQKTGRMMAEIGTRFYEDIDKKPEEKEWKMHNQPSYGLVWLEQTGSAEYETVWAWAEIEETPFPEILPEGVTKSLGYVKDKKTLKEGQR